MVFALLVQTVQMWKNRYPMQLPRKWSFLLTGTCLVLVLCYQQGGNIINMNQTVSTAEMKGRKYLIQGPNCRIPDLEAFNAEMSVFYKPQTYIPCSDYDLLTYTKTVNGSEKWLFVNMNAVRHYTRKKISCCYSQVKRITSRSLPDDTIGFSDCVQFKSATIVPSEVVMVKCYKLSNNQEIYRNVHSFMSFPRYVKSKLEASEKSKHKPLSILFIGIDSISRLNFMRVMPKSYQFVTQNKWINLQGYNKVGENTFPNLMAILTGMNSSQAHKTCNPKQTGGLDECDILWYKYRDLGFVTGYAEDQSSIGTFNYMKKGFKKAPTDFYFRPYFLVAETLNKSTAGMTYCTGPESSGERVLNLAHDFAVSLMGYPSFGFFWMNSFSHDDINLPGRIDSQLENFLVEIAQAGVLEKSIVIFLSDHGFRIGDPSITRAGWLEDRLPFIYLWFPAWFKKQFPLEYKNIESNTKRLTTPYDLHMTLQHIPKLLGYNYQISPSKGCPKCHSLLYEIAKNRSCEEAGIEPLWCTCNDYEYMDKSSPIVTAAAEYMLQELKSILTSYGEEAGQCAEFSLRRIKTAMSDTSSGSIDDNTSHVIVILETMPYALFEASLKIKNTNEGIKASLESNIYRIDRYSDTSYCILDYPLKSYCYCKNIFTNFISMFCKMFAMCT